MMLMQMLESRRSCFLPEDPPRVDMPALFSPVRTKCLMRCTMAGLISLYTHTQACTQARTHAGSTEAPVSLHQRDGREMCLDFVVDHTLAPVAHAICSRRWLCSAPRWLTKTAAAKKTTKKISLPLRRGGGGGGQGGRANQRYQPIPDGFQNVGLRG